MSDELKDSPLSDVQKVMLPFIHNILPSTIATEIMGVQPMTGPTGKIYRIKYDFSKETLQAEVLTTVEKILETITPEMAEWCIAAANSAYKQQIFDLLDQLDK